MSDCDLETHYLKVIYDHNLPFKCTWTKSQTIHANNILRNNRSGMDDVDSVTRKDITSLRTFAVDGKNAELIDDAFSYDMDSKRIYVHIADPTAFFHEGHNDPIIKEALERYRKMELPPKTLAAKNEVTDMFPKKLTKRLLSLDATYFSERVPALTVTFRVRKDGSVQSRSIKIFPSWIKKPIKFSHSVADEHIANRTFAEWPSVLRRVKIMRNFRENACYNKHTGVINNSNCKFLAVRNINAKGMIEELMTATNVAVGKYGRQVGIKLVFFKRKPDGKTKLSYHSGEHATVGVDVCARVTSPLWNSECLVNHFQLKAALKKEEAPFKGSTLRKEVQYLRRNFANYKNYEYWLKGEKKNWR